MDTKNLFNHGSNKIGKQKKCAIKECSEIITIANPRHKYCKQCALDKQHESKLRSAERRKQK